MLPVTPANRPKRAAETAKPSERCHDIKDGAAWRAASVLYDGVWLDEQAVVAEAKSHEATFIARWHHKGRGLRSLHTREEIHFVDVPSTEQVKMPAHHSNFTEYWQ